MTATTISREPNHGWRAELALSFQRAQFRTVLARRRHRGPLLVQRPFYPGDGTCHVYLLHPPGGVVSGDSLAIDVTVGAAAHALVTTPAAGKFYRSAGPLARQSQVLRLGNGSTLEWLPQEAILFDGARVRCSTKVELAAGARFLGWEIACLGRPACAEAFDHGHLRQTFEVWRDNRPLWIERARIDGGSPLLYGAWGLAGQPVFATMVGVPAGAPELDTARAAPQGGIEGFFGATLVDEALVCRYLGPSVQEARARMLQIWEKLRPGFLGRHAAMPRIWRT